MANGLWDPVLSLSADGYGVELQNSERSEQAGGGDPGGARARPCPRPRFLVLLALAPLIWAVRFYVPMHEGIAAASRLHLSRSRSEMCTASRGTRASASARPSLT